MDDFDKEFEALAGPAEPVQDEGEPQVAMADAELPEPVEGAEEPTAEAPAETPEPAEPPAPATLDELFGLIPQDKAERFQTVVQQVRSDLGRVSALNRLYADQKAAAEQAAQRFEEAQKQLKDLQERAASDVSAKEAKEIEGEADELEQQFPELAKAVKLTVKNLIRQEIPAKAAEPQAPQAQVTPPEPPKADDAVEALASEFAALEAAHPDWQTARNRPEFMPWLQAQPKSLQELVRSNKAQDAIVLMDSFKRDLKAAAIRAETERQAANRKRLEQNVGVKSAPPRITSVPNDFESAFNFFANGR